MTRCPGSGTEQMLTWMPDEATGYPGAALCIHCSCGILVLKRSVKDAVSRAGFEGKSGIMRVHDKPKKEKKS